MSRIESPPLGSPIVVERRGAVDLITINRPHARNALTREAYDQVEEAVRSSTAHCLVITGAGTAFCSGDDVKEFMAGGAHVEYLRSADTLHSFTEAILHSDIPVLAAVNGAAVGWGMELALMADIRIAGPTARFGEVFVLRGLCSDAPGMALLAGLVGREQAARLLLTGEIIDAARAFEIGLVSELVASDVVLPRALELAEAIAANPPLAIRKIKQGLRRALDPDWAQLGSWVRTALTDLSLTNDHRESVEAFLAKRSPRFVGG